MHTAYHPTISAEYNLPDLASAFEGAQSEIRQRFRQHALSAALNADAWLKALAACHAFDSANHTALISHREATRLISYSQAGSGAFLLRVPDPSLHGSVVDSVSCRHIGLTARFALQTTFPTLSYETNAVQLCIGIIGTHMERSRWPS